jgi:hypothetical protein
MILHKDMSNIKDSTAGDSNKCPFQSKEVVQNLTARPL